MLPRFITNPRNSNVIHASTYNSPANWGTVTYKAITGVEIESAIDVKPKLSRAKIAWHGSYNGGVIFSQLNFVGSGTLFCVGARGCLLGAIPMEGKICLAATFSSRP
jgi:hypothetical protein